jgi:molybdopterin-guanine dinucleotide biosynthesis protein A
MQITSIILAGGKSTRMGTDKVLLKVNKKTLLEKAIELVRPFSDSIIISSNSREHEMNECVMVFDEIENCGPMGGLFSCLKKSQTEWNFVLSVDSAFVEPEFILDLISEIDESEAIIPIHAKGKEPLIACYHEKSLAEMEKMLCSGDYKMHNLLHKLDTKLVDVRKWTNKYPKLFFNLNRPEDL